MSPILQLISFFVFCFVLYVIYLIYDTHFVVKPNGVIKMTVLQRLHWTFLIMRYRFGMLLSGGTNRL